MQYAGWALGLSLGCRDRTLTGWNAFRLWLGEEGMRSGLCVVVATIAFESLYDTLLGT